MEETSEEDLKSLVALSETEKAVALFWSTLIPGLDTKTLRYVKDESSRHFFADAQIADPSLGPTRIFSTTVGIAYSLSRCYYFFEKS